LVFEKRKLLATSCWLLAKARTCDLLRKKKLLAAGCWLLAKAMTCDPLRKKKLLAASCWLLAKAMTCDPLPTEQRKRKNQAEIGADSTAEKHEKRLSTAR
jgi:hypothetical protein